VTSVLSRKPYGLAAIALQVSTCSSRTAVQIALLRGVTPSHDGTSFKFPRGIKGVFTVPTDIRTSTHSSERLARAALLPLVTCLQTGNWKFSLIIPYYSNSLLSPPKPKSSCRFSDVTVMLATIWPTSHRGDEAGPCSAPTRKGTVRTTHRTLIN
jgi:hypothetical protein